MDNRPIGAVEKDDRSFTRIDGLDELLERPFRRGRRQSTREDSGEGCKARGRRRVYSERTANFVQEVVEARRISTIDVDPALLSSRRRVLDVMKESGLSGPCGPEHEHVEVVLYSSLDVLIDLSHNVKWLVNACSQKRAPRELHASNNTNCK